MPKKKNIVLVVEDDRAIARAIEFRLKQEGYQVDIARDGEEALTMVHENHPDLILLDLILPKVNGFEVLKKIKEDETTRSIDVIIFSNLSQKEDMAQAQAYGAIQFLVKSDLSTSELAAIVNKYFTA